MVLTGSRGSRLEIPQEIIDQIIDHVAYQTFHPDDLDETISIDTLKTCALVSRAFNSRSRWHIFSSIEFTANKNSRRRAARLVKILQRKDNRVLLCKNIHTFKYMFDVPLPMAPGVLPTFGLDSRPFTRLRNFIFRNLQNFGIVENKLYQIFDTMAEASLTHFAFGARIGFLRWRSRIDIDEKFLRLISHPTLESLRVSNVMGLPLSMVQSAFYSSNLRELVLCNIAILRTGTLPASDHVNPVNLAKLERLELRRISYSGLLSIMKNPVPSVDARSGSTTASSFPTFPHLRVLAVTVPYPTEMDSLWEIIQHVAPTLETLDIEYHGSPELSDSGPISLRSLTTLRHLCFTSISFTPGGDLEPKQRSLANLLSSATSPMSLESVSFTFHVRSGLSDQQPSFLCSGNGWALLDDALASIAFVNLRSVTCDVKIFRQDITLDSTDKSKLAKHIDPSLLFPRMVGSSLVNVSVSSQTITSPKEMHTYLCGF